MFVSWVVTIAVESVVEVSVVVAVSPSLLQAEKDKRPVARMKGMINFIINDLGLKISNIKSYAPTDQQGAKYSPANFKPAIAESGGKCN
jgi:hypothetical protein